MKGRLKRVLKFLCGAAFSCAVAVGVPQWTGTVQAAATAEPVAIDEENFPDEVFREYVSANLDTDGNGKLSSDEIMTAI